PHLYCLPILKRETDRQALLDVACSGNPKFFLGTDSAPHAQHRKESDCGCAGSFTAYAAMELYAHAFEERNALDKLEGFSSVHGAQFYGLPLNEKRVRLRLREQVVPAFFQFSKDKLIPFWAKNKLRWTLES
ncbi:MAG: dihydroorotase, partial [Myxococcota bacterium]|nr:dihydroorotase [Myxococcota bacterium]